MFQSINWIWLTVILFPLLPQEVFALLLIFILTWQIIILFLIQMTFDFSIYKMQNLETFYVFYSQICKSLLIWSEVTDHNNYCYWVFYYITSISSVILPQIWFCLQLETIFRQTIYLILIQFTEVLYPQYSHFQICLWFDFICICVSS